MQLFLNLPSAFTRPNRSGFWIFLPEVLLFGSLSHYALTLRSSDTALHALQIHATASSTCHGWWYLMRWVSAASTLAYKQLSLLQGSAGQVSKVDTDGGDLPEDLNIGFSGKGPGIYGSFGTGKPATRAATAPQVSIPVTWPAESAHMLQALCSYTPYFASCMVICHAPVVQTAKLPVCLDVTSGAIIHSISGSVTGCYAQQHVPGTVTFTAMTVTVKSITAFALSLPLASLKSQYTLT